MVWPVTPRQWVSFVTYYATRYVLGPLVAIVCLVMFVASWAYFRPELALVATISMLGHLVVASIIPALLAYLIYVALRILFKGSW
jgi:hypothetical protein